MQSSTVTSARTLLMFVCMIVLPVLALVGTGWTRYFDFGSKPDASERSATTRHPAAPPAPAEASAPLAGPGQPSETTLAVNAALAPAPRWNGETAATPGAAPPAGTPPASVTPASANSAPGTPPRDATEPRDWFTLIQQRLRSLGATYYLLETWGANGELYRFHCKMAVAGNQGFTRHFEATDSNASRAMQSVLEQVELWRSGRLR